MKTDDETSIALTIKNYNQEAGLSKKFFDHNIVDFEVKGPMGKPLNVETTGNYVVFAGGTGVLPFMDLVLQLALAILGLTEAVG